MNTKDIVNISLFATLLAVCAWICIPTMVPVTMQTFAVFLALLVLGGKKGILAAAGKQKLGIFSGAGHVQYADDVFRFLGRAVAVHPVGQDQRCLARLHAAGLTVDKDLLTSLQQQKKLDFSMQVRMEVDVEAPAHEQRYLMSFVKKCVAHKQTLSAYMSRVYHRRWQKASVNRGIQVNFWQL